MVHHSGASVCIKHREVNHWGSCNICGNSDVYLPHNWRAPRKTNDAAWKKIAKGQYWWDIKAKYRRAQRERSLYPWARKTRKEISATQRAHIRRVYKLDENDLV